MWRSINRIGRYVNNVIENVFHGEGEGACVGQVQQNGVQRDVGKHRVDLLGLRRGREGRCVCVCVCVKERDRIAAYPSVEISQSVA